MIGSEPLKMIDLPDVIEKNAENTAEIRMRDVLQRLRKLAKQTQRQMADELGKTEATIARWEHGYVPPKSARVALRHWLGRRPGLITELSLDETKAVRKWLWQ